MSSSIINTVLAASVIFMIAAIVMSEFNYLIGKPECIECKIRNILSKRKKKKNPGYHITGNTPDNQTDTAMIRGVAPPTNANTRVMIPAVAASLVEITNPDVIGTFGVSDSSNPVFGDDDVDISIAGTVTPVMELTPAHKISGPPVMELTPAHKINNQGGVVMDGKIVTNECQLPPYQIRESGHVSELPNISFVAEAVVEDIVDEGISDGLSWAAIDVNGADLNPPGTATPMSEFAYINYGPTNNQ